MKITKVTKHHNKDGTVTRTEEDITAEVEVLQAVLAIVDPHPMIHHPHQK